MGALLPKIARELLTCCAALLAVVGLGTCGRDAGEVVAQVGRTSIGKTTLAHWMAVQAGDQSMFSRTTSRPLARDPPGYVACVARLRESATADKNRSRSAAPLSDHRCSQVYDALEQRVLDFLISSAWTIGQAGELGVKVSDEEVTRQLERFKYYQIERYAFEPSSKEAELQRLLSSKQESVSDQSWIMRVHLLAAKVEQAQLAEAERQVTPKQIATYYEQNRWRFVVPEQRDVEAIMTHRRDSVERAKRELEAGRSFMSVAEAANEQPSEGGLRLGLSRRSMGDKRYERDFFAAPPHVLVGPLKELLYYIFEVTEVTPARQQTLAQVEPAVRRQLVTGGLRKLFTNVVEVFDRRWRARTNCSPGYVVNKCEQQTGERRSASR